MIEAKDLAKSYGKKKVFSSLSFSLPDGGSLVLLGPSGSGKSTLLSIVSLLDSSYEGTLLIDGKDPSALSKKEAEKLRLETFGYVFPDARLLSYLTIKENALLPLRLLHRKADLARLERLAARLGISELLGRLPREVSEGERQRAAILRSLLPSPRCLVADEPTSHLDFELAKEAMGLLRETAKEEKASLIVSTHQEELAASFEQAIRL